MAEGEARQGNSLEHFELQTRSARVKIVSLTCANCNRRYNIRGEKERSDERRQGEKE